MVRAIHRTPSAAGCSRNLIICRRNFLTISLLAACLLPVLTGCKSDEKPKEAASSRPLEGVKLRLVVVDDSSLAAAITRARGEWNTQTGADLEVTTATEHDLLSAGVLPADAVVCSSHLLGVLAEHRALSPAPQTILSTTEWRSLFPLLKLREAAWAKATLAVPFGSPLLTVYYRADLLEQLGRQPPQTWTEYQEIAQLFTKSKPQSAANASDSKTTWCATIEPLASGWAGQTLLARAAAYARHRDNYSTLFNIDDMQPLIATPPFLKALEELVAAAKLGPADPFRYDPLAARAAFWRGECAMALSWPTAATPAPKSATADKEDLLRLPAKPDPMIRVGFCELPGAGQSYNRDSQTWEDRTEDENPHVPLLSIAGRLGVVSAKCQHVDAAFQLLLWLSGSRMSSEISPNSTATTLFRESNTKAPGQWVEKLVPAPAAVRYADITEAALGRSQWLATLCLPGRAEYLAALDQAVASAVQGKKSPQDALLEAASEWRKITERLGLPQQRAAYRHSLGLE